MPFFLLLNRVIVTPVIDDDPRTSTSVVIYGDMYGVLLVIRTSINTAVDDIDDDPGTSTSVQQKMMLYDAARSIHSLVSSFVFFCAAAVVVDF